MTRISDEDRAVLLERERYLDGTAEADNRPLRVRPEIAASWKRSTANAVDPTRLPEDFQRLGETQFSALALPVIDHHLQMLTDTRTSLLFSDAEGRLIGRWTHDSGLRNSLARANVEAGFMMSEGVVGTNGVGTVFEAGTAVEIKGPEHFSDVYLPFTCVGAPIRHPVTRRIIGVVDVTYRREESSAMAMPWILNLARLIENRLLEHSTIRERALLNAYVMANRRSQVAVACLNGDMVISNPEASALLNDTDQNHIWSHLQLQGFRTPSIFTPLELPTGRVLMLRARTVRHEGSILGAVVEAYEPQSLSTKSHEPRAIGRSGLPGLVGVSTRWENVCDQAFAWTSDDAGVVVTGEPGVGKMAVLRAAFSSERVDVFECSLVLVDGARDWLAALRTRLEDPAGVVVLRHVHLLDDPVAQAVCSLLDEVESPPRIAATVVSGSGSEPFAPLIARFGVHHLEVPALRHRLDDLAVLLADLSDRASGRGPRWLPETVQVLAEQSWPDNVRGLAALVKRVMRTRAVGVVSLADLPDEIAIPRETQRTLTQLERLERQEIIETLSSVGGNKVRAAAKLNLARSTLYRKMTSLGIPHTSPHTRARR